MLDAAAAHAAAAPLSTDHSVCMRVWPTGQGILRH